MDISLIRQDMTKLWERVTEAETRISRAEDTLYPLQHSQEDLKHQIQQLAQKHDDCSEMQRKTVPPEGDFCTSRYAGETLCPHPYLETQLA